MTWSGAFRSGMAFTPGVAGDINGDGYWNDRAFIYDPSRATDPALAAGMRQLLAGASAGTRRCLESQLGRIAARNSCTAPWTSSASLNVTLDRAKFRMPDRGEVSFSLSNPLGAADLALHGSDNLKGWGQSAYPDPSLLYVRGFDPASRQYRYEVNQRFGSTRPQTLTLRAPVVLTVSVRMDLGPTREQQMLAEQLRNQNAMRRVPEQFLRMMATGSVSNPMSSILRSQDTLRLTAQQADSIAAMNRRYTYRADSLWSPVAHYIATIKPDSSRGGGSRGDIFERYLQARRAQVDMLAGIGPAVRGLLTPEQKRKLPSYVMNYLDGRYLSLIRNGTRTYVGGGSPGFSAFFGGFEMGAAMASSIMFSGGAGQQIITVVRSQ